jgi:hypothetical protein
LVSAASSKKGRKVVIFVAGTVIPISSKFFVQQPLFSSNMWYSVRRKQSKKGQRIEKK